MRVLLTSLTKGLLRQPAGTGAQLLNTFRAQSSSASVVYRNTVSPRIPMLLGRPSATPLAQFTQRAGIRIKASDPNADKASSPRGNNNDQAASPNAPGEAEKEAERKERNSQQEAEDADSQGLDLFAQAAANQRRREAAAAAGPQGGGKAAGAESEVDEGHHHMDPKEAERIKKWKQQAEEEEKRQMQRSTRMFMFTLGMFSLSAFVYLGIPTEEQRADAEESYFTNYHIRAWNNLKNLRTTLESPVSTKLLPDPLPAPYQRPLTLCVELTDALVHLEWDKSVGWRVATRPGVKQFLANLSRYYEVVIFTNSPGYLAEPVCQALDPHFFYAMYRLYRDHTKLVDGVYVKDLSQLNRDIGKTIILDINPESYKLQPENGLKLKPWKGERGDQELKKLETFFEELYVFATIYGMEDIRPILNIVNSIDPDDVASSWATYKEKVREDFNQRIPEINEATNSSRSWLSRMLGGVTGNTHKPVNIIDTIESLAREERALAEQDADNMKQQMNEVQKQQEEFIKKQMEENKSKGLKLWDYWNGAGQVAPPGQPGAPPQQ